LSDVKKTKEKEKTTKNKEKKDERKRKSDVRERIFGGKCDMYMYALLLWEFYFHF